MVSSRALIERIRKQLGSIHEKIVAHRYLAAIKAGDLTRNRSRYSRLKNIRQSQATSGASRYCFRVMGIFQAGYRDDLQCLFRREKGWMSWAETVATVERGRSSRWFSAAPWYRYRIFTT